MGTHASDSPWDHGFAANHEWQLVARSDSSLTIAIDLPASEPIARLEQCIAVDPDAAAVSVTLLVHARRAVTLPVALHPTFAVPAEGVEVLGCGFSHIETYPVPQEPGVSRIAPNMQAQGLNALPTADGPLDLTRLPLPIKTEELFQLVDCKPPFVLRYPTGTVELEWDSKQLPDALVWISNAGRDHAPWNGRHYAIGVEPANSVFDLARVATPPAEHGLAQRKGIAFSLSASPKSRGGYPHDSVLRVGCVAPRGQRTFRLCHGRWMAPWGPRLAPQNVRCPQRG